MVALNTPAEIAQFIPGPCLAGVFMNIMLYGVMLTQTFYYFSTYRRDQRWIKLYVGLLFFADTLNTIFNIWWAYNALINNFGNVNTILVADWRFQTQIALTGVISGQVQGFYAWRLHKLNAHKWVVGPIYVLSVVTFLGAIGTTINMAIKPHFLLFAHYKEIVLTWLISSVLNDVSIATAITWQLKNSRTGHSHTDTVISRIIQITMSNGLMTAAFALADIIAFVSSSGGLHMAFNFVLTKLYGNSVLTTLNSRSILLPHNDGIMNASIAPSADMGEFRSKSNMNMSKVSRAQVVVNVETHQMADIESVSGKGEVDWNDDHSYGKASSGSVM